MPAYVETLTIGADGKPHTAIGKRTARVGYSERTDVRDIWLIK
jgi:hypothetical protein